MTDALRPTFPSLPHDTPSPDEVSCHEAAHAITAVARGVAVIGTAITPDDPDGRGYVRLADADRLAGTLSGLCDLMAVAAAGPVVSLATGRTASASAGYDAGYLRHCLGLYRERFPGLPEPDPYKAAAHTLTQPGAMAAVMAVARTLRTRGRLTGAEVEAITRGEFARLGVGEFAPGRAS